MRKRGAVWIHEDEVIDIDGTVLLATFSGFHDTGGSRPGEEFHALPIDEAIAWGRERADKVYVTLGWEGRYWAGAGPSDEYPAWPPEDLPRPVRRRPRGEEWKDRTDADEPIRWAVSAWLRLAGGSMPGRDRDGEVAAIAERCGAEGWDADELDGALADVERARRAARGSESYSWFSYHRGAYRLQFAENAPTRERAIEQARRRCGTPDGWAVEFDAEPG
jgi:hypothetical protein